MLYPDESYQIMGACFEVHNHQGSGFLEAVYQECLEIEFTQLQIPFIAQPRLKLRYRDHILEQVYQPDFICYEKILIEIKAVDQLIDKHEAQVINYLHASGLQLGILVNFGGCPKLETKRFALSEKSARESRE